MARPITWAVRLTLSDGRVVFARVNGAIGRGPIATFRTKDQADTEAKHWRRWEGHVQNVEVIERSHGRQLTGH